MSTPAKAVPDPKQAAYAALNDLFKSAEAAANNPANTKAAQDAAFDLATATSAQLDALDQAVFTGNTVQLQAAAATLTPGMTDLKNLQKRIAAIGNDLKEATALISEIDKAVSGLAILA